MKAQKYETWRHRYIRILTEPADASKDSQEDLQAIEDLTEEHLIRARVIRDHLGALRMATGLFIPTLKGRLFIEDQQAVLRSKTLIERFKANLPLFSGFIIAFIGWGLGLLTPLIQQRFQARIHIQDQQQNKAASPAKLTQQTPAQPKPLTPPAASITTNPTKP